MVVAPRAFVQSGPIFLDELICTESDTTLQGCSRGIAGIGLTSCNHTKDVWVQCSGTFSIKIWKPRNQMSCVHQIRMNVLLLMEDVNTTAPTLLVVTTVHVCLATS